MPIEIKELVIRTVVDGSSGAGPAGGHGAGPSATDATTTEEIVQECVRQVLRVLKAGRER